MTRVLPACTLTIHPLSVKLCSIPLRVSTTNQQPFVILHLLSPQLHSQFASQLLCLATVIPVPDDRDSEMDDESVNPMSSSTPYKVSPPAPSLQASFSPHSDRSPPFTISNALSNGSSRKSSRSALVEDALRACAEQGQSAAEWLLELNDPDGEDNQHSTIAPSLLLGSGIAMPKPKMPNASTITQSLAVTVTPDNRDTVIFCQATLFKNSPANTSRRFPLKASSGPST
ncbi:hypothetical protein M405DRAFT_98313 [Rhizopogon salebrosus TDB-379]|nr:hypothetical protein M405DRAFT_98313 [Rhizopogon salebrosus TDB-379]